VLLCSKSLKAAFNEQMQKNAAPGKQTAVTRITRTENRNKNKTTVNKTKSLNFDRNKINLECCIGYHSFKQKKNQSI
jgi:hypothetical protein